MLQNHTPKAQNLMAKSFIYIITLKKYFLSQQYILSLDFIVFPSIFCMLFQDVFISFRLIFIKHFIYYFCMNLRLTNSQTYEPNLPLSQPSNESQSQTRKKITLSMVRELQRNSKKMEVNNIGVTDIIRSTMRFFICKMCYNNVQLSQTDSVGQCQHRFCIDCLIQYSIYKITVNQDIICPEQGCKYKLSPNCELFGQLPISMQEKYKQYQLWKQTLNNPNVKLCPSQTCKGGLIDLLKDPPECQKCHNKFCQFCLMNTHEGPCDKNYSQMIPKQWKRCPHCSILIQKTQGCNQMACKCKHQFCFICLQNWSPTHYICQGAFKKMFCFNSIDSVPKCLAVFYIFCFLLLIPIFIVLSFLFLVVGVALGMIFGALASIPLALSLAKDCDCGLFSLLLCLILLPLTLILGSIGGPILFSITVWYPVVYSTLCQSYNTLQFLCQQLN